MPDFDTRKPPGTNETGRFRFPFGVNRLRSMATASKRRILSMANTLWGSLMANRLRSLLIATALLLVATAIPVYSSGWIGDQRWKAKDANLTPLAVCPDSGSGQKRVVMDDDSSAKKIVFVSGPQPNIGSPETMSDKPVNPGTGMYVINADGSGLTRLTRATAAEFGIPDSLLLGDREIESAIEHQSDVVASPVASPEPGEQTVCSPDGKKLASLTSTTTEATDDDSSAPPADWDISVRTSAGTADLGDPDYDYTIEISPIFSPDSRKLAFTKDIQVYVANADGSDPTQLTDDMRYTAVPRFSPDSKKIAFVTDTPGAPDTEDLYIIDVDGTNLTRLTHNTRQFGKTYNILEGIDSESGILFSPDSKKIAFVVYRLKKWRGTPIGKPVIKLPLRYDIHVVNVDGTGLTRLTHTEALEERIVTWAGR